ncbi:MAG: SRPBCC domain-containing protein, partial [Pseudonocardia sp.]|nr:SRPBCC domain-containing protein [Pseudonocardia sp.]
MNQPSEQIIAAQPDEVRRELSVKRDRQTQHTVQTISQSYPTTVDDLWAACTQPDRLARWLFAPVGGDLRLGGRYHVEGNASGEVVACDPPRSFTLTRGIGHGSRSSTRTPVTPTRSSGPGSAPAPRGWAGTSPCLAWRCTWSV